MERKQGHLSLQERQQIHLMREQGKGFAEIGRALERHRSVVKRELERNSGPSQIWRHMTPLERAKSADERAKRRQVESKCGVRGPLKLCAVRARIEELLEHAHYSPEKIAFILSSSDEGVSLCGRTIRRWLDKDAPELKQHLPCRGKKYRRRMTGKRRHPIADKAAPEKRSIHERDEIVSKRERVGDLEADMMVCRQSKVGILSVIDRKTRRRWFRKVKNLKAETLCHALICLLLTIPATERHTITFDRGGEFAEWQELERFFHILPYFCDAYCAWQKGSVEHSNKKFRRFVPKGTNLALVSDEHIAKIEAILNTEPMICLGMLSAYQAWHLECGGTFFH